MSDSPRTIGGRIDALYRQREKIRELEARVKEEKEKYKHQEDQLLKAMDKSQLEASRGRLATASITQTDRPTIKDYERFIKYVRDNEAFDLLQRRVSTTAWRERLDEGEKVPGIEVYPDIKIYLRKRS